MNFTQSIKQTPRWNTLIKQTRRRLKESQRAFGERFGVTQSAVSDWERGMTYPPADVTWWLHQLIVDVEKRRA